LEQVLPKVCKTTQPTPFDISYLAADRGQGIVAVRPAAIALLFPQLKADTRFRPFVHLFLQMMVDIDLDVAELPALSELEQCVSNLSLQVSSPSEGQKGTFMFGAAAPVCLRTVRPFDWAGRLAKWFPAAKHEHHAGRDYLTMPCKLLFGKEPMQLAFFVADGRTLICSTEPDLRDLLDRLDKGKPGPTPPPGWAAVNRDMFAMVIDARTNPWFKGTWPTDTPELRQAGTLVKGLTVVAAGVSMSAQPKIHLVATARSEKALGKISAALEPLSAAACKQLTDPEQHLSPALASLLGDCFQKASMEQQGLTLRIETQLPANLVSLLASAGSHSAP
jgi:hypothetical protein